MSTYRLDRLFAPRSIAIVGASPREHSLGRAILRNVTAGSFGGPVRLVDSRHAEIDGIAAVPSIADLPDVPDLVVIAVPAPAVPETVAVAAAKGVAAAGLLTGRPWHWSRSPSRAALAPPPPPRPPP